ncbi:MAG: hypothetical protein RI906_2867, partial [Pseudomonadota bacterium]
GLRADTNYTSVITGSSTISFGGRTATVPYTITPNRNFGNYTAGAGLDQAFSFQIELPDNFADSVAMYFGSTLDSAYTDEAWQVDNLSFWQRNVPSNPGLGGTLETFEGGVTTGWDNGGNSTGNYRNDVTVTRPGNSATTAMWFGNAPNPTKIYAIDNEATRIEFDFYALDSWDSERFYARINGVDVVDFVRVTGTNYTDVVTGSAVVNGKAVTFTVTPNNDHGNWSTTTGNASSGHTDQSFRVVIDLPEDFGTSFALQFDTNLNSGGADESAAVDNIRVYSRENTGWIDPYTGVLQPSPTDNTVASQNIVLNGDNEYVDIGTLSGTSRLTGDFTLEAWVFAEAANTWARVFDLGNGQQNHNVFLTFLGNEGKIEMGVYDGSTKYAISTTALLPLGQWVHLAAVNLGNGNGRIYFNGVEQTTTRTSGTTLIGATDVDRTTNYIGRSNWAVDDFFRGQINNARIWNDVRTEAEIQAGMNNPLSAADLADANLLGFWSGSQLDGNGVIQDLSAANRDGNLIRRDDFVRLDQYASIHLTNLAGVAATDDGWADIYGLATDGRKLYHYYNDNRIIAYNMDGRQEKTLTVSSATVGNTQTGMAYSSGWLYIRNPGAADVYANTSVMSNPADDKIFRISPEDGTTLEVTLDASMPLLGTRGWQTGNIMGLPDGRLGIFSGNYATGAATVRLYTLADNGSRLVWSEDYTLNIGANWLNDLHGAATDGTLLYVSRHEAQFVDDYRVFDLRTGRMVFDGSSTNLYQQSVDNATHLAIDPLNGDIYFADFAGSHVGRAARENGALRQAVVEFGADGTALPTPLLTTGGSIARPDIFVTDARELQVRVGNTAPAVSNWTTTVSEDGRLSFTASDFTVSGGATRFSDPEGDTLATITLTSVPNTASQGVLQLNGITQSNGAPLNAGDLDRLVFVPVANFNGSATFSYTASDGNLSSSINTDTTKRTATVTLTVSAVNDAPVLDAAQSPALTGISEDVSDAANTGTLISDIVVNNSMTDVDVVSPATAPEAIAVTRVNNTNGVWQYKAGAGAWTAFTATTGREVDLEANARLLDASDRVRFVPNAHYNGNSSITFRAWDKSSGVAGDTTNPSALGGNTAVSSVSDTASIAIQAVNDPPTGNNKTLNADEDTDYSFTATDFGFADATDGGAHTLSAVIIQSLPAAGALTFNGSNVSIGQSIAVASLGNLKFRGAQDAFGNNYASFSFKLQDSGGTANSGVDISVSANTLTLNLADTNDAPTAISWASGGSVPEDASPTATPAVVVGKLTGSDPNTGDILRFSRVTNAGFNVDADGTVTVSSLARLDFERSPMQTVRVRATDSGGLTYDQDITVTLTDVVESAPSLVTQAIYIRKDGTEAQRTITVSHTTNLRASDAQQTAAQLTYTVSEAVEGGVFWLDVDLDGVRDSGEEIGPVNDASPSARDTFTQADVVAGKLKFTKDTTQTSARLALSLSDGTESVSGSLLAIASSPPVVSPVDDQIWATTGAQSFVLPSATFSDPDQDVLTVTATRADGSPLPSWLSFNASTWTFSGTPSGVNNGDTLNIKVSATDGRYAAVDDTFVITFNATVTQPAVSNPVSEITFNGAGTQSYVFAANTFTARAGHPITSYTATLASGGALPGWLSFNSTTRTFSGNPGVALEPGPYAIKLTANTASGGSASNTFELYVANANDAPTVASAQPDRTIANADEYTYPVTLSSAFTDGDGDAMTLSARLPNGDALPSWIRFVFDEVAGKGSFIVKAPSGSGSVTVRLVSRDIYGAEGFDDFVITYSGGRNSAPSVQTSAGITTMDGRGQLNTDSTQKLELFGVAQGEHGLITKDFLRELDLDDDGTGLTYTVTTLPARGQLWLDSDASGTVNGSETLFAVGSTFTQADIDNEKLRYRNTDTTTAAGSDPPDDSFIFKLKDGGEDGAAEIVGASFSIQVKPKPPSPTLLSVLRSAPQGALTGEDELTFKVEFSEAVRGVDVSDFDLRLVSGGLTGTVSAITALNSSVYYLTVSGGNLATNSGELGLQLSASPSIARSTNNAVSISTSSLQPTVNDQIYTLENTAPTVTLSAAISMHDGSTAFYAYVDFNEAVSGLTLDDIQVSNATLSGLLRVSTDPSSDPDNQPGNYDPNNPPAVQGNRYRVLVTPSGQVDVVMSFAANQVTDNANNPNTAATSLTITGNRSPVIALDAVASPPAANRSATFTETDGADTATGAVSFTTAGTSIADLDTGQGLVSLTISVLTAQIKDGSSEQLRVQGATANGVLQLDTSLSTTALTVTLGGIDYTATPSVQGGVNRIVFTKTGGGNLTLAQAETLLDALHYNHSSDQPTAGNRVLSVSAYDGWNNSNTTTLTATVSATNDTPTLSAGAPSATLIEVGNAQAGVAASSITLSKGDLDGTANFDGSYLSANGWTTADSGVTYTKTGTYGTATLATGSGVLSYALNNSDTDTQALVTGTTVTDSFAVRVTDGSATALVTVSFSIQGSDDAPTLAVVNAITYTDTSANDTFSNTERTLVGGDDDAGTTLSYAVTHATATASTGSYTVGSKTYDRELIGQYGTLYLASTAITVSSTTTAAGSYVYVPNDTAMEGLKENATDSFTLTVSDGVLTTSRTLAVNITAANDLADFSLPSSSVSFADTSADDSFTLASGSLGPSDRDAGEALRFSITGGSADGRQVGYDIGKQGTYGTLFINATSGAWAYVPDKAAIEKRTAAASDSFDVVLTDGTDPVTKTFSVQITGANDVPVLAAITAPDAVTELTDASAQDIAAISGTLSVTDRDAGNTLTASIVGSPVVARNGSAFTLPAGASALTAAGALTLTGTPTSDGTAKTISWSYNPGAADLDFLGASQQLTLTYTLRVSDGATNTGTQDLVITIAGSDDAPALASVTNISLTDTSADNSFSNTTGTLSGSDADSNATLTYSIAGETSGSYTVGSNTYNRRVIGDYGTLYLASASGAYEFVPDDNAVEGLKAAISEGFSLSVSDGTASASRMLTVSITAANDLPGFTLSTVSFTDTTADDSFTPASGSLAPTDRDNNEVLTFSLGSSSANTTGPTGYDLYKTGNYGTLYINSASGAWTYVPNSSAINARTTNDSDSFALTLTDASAATSAQTLTVQIVAANDVPSVTAGAATVLEEKGGIANGVPGVASSSVTLTLVDRDGTASLDATQLTNAGWTTSDSGFTYTKSGTYGSATLTTATRVIDYALDDTDADTQALLAGSSVTESFVVGVTDGTATGSVTVSFTIRGANDDTVLTAAAAGATLVEAGGIANGASGTSSSSITLTLADADGLGSTAGLGRIDTAELLATGWTTA